MDTVLASAFAVWFGLSLYGQFQSPRTDTLRRYDVLQLLPIWTFFAPNPGSSDYHVIVRDRRSDGTISEWRDAMPIPAQTATSWVWNPMKRRQKVLVDAVASIAEMCAPTGDRALQPHLLRRALMVSSPYLVLLNMVVNCAEHASGTLATQFAVVERVGFGQEARPTVMFRSPFHGLGG